MTAEGDLNGKSGSRERDAACRRIQPHLHPYVEGELDPIRGQLVDGHLQSCETCRDSVEYLKIERILFVEACVDSPELPDSFTGRVMRRVEAESPVAARRARPGWFRLGGFAAAALVIASIALVVDRSGGVRQAPTPSIALESRNPEHAALRVLYQEHPGLRVPRTLTAVGSTGVEDPFAAIYTRNFGHVAGMVRSIAPSATAAPDPCTSDSNFDGRADWNDIAYACQVILSGRPPSPMERGEMLVSDVDCDDFCRA